MAGAALIAQGIEKRRAILKFLRAQAKRGLTPSVEEIADHLQVSSKNAVRHHLQVLIDEGFITMVPRQHRSIRVIRDGRYPR